MDEVMKPVLLRRPFKLSNGHEVFITTEFENCPECLLFGSEHVDYILRKPLIRSRKYTCSYCGTKYMLVANWISPVEVELESRRI